MKKLLEISLGIVTSIGGFLEIGSITTAAQAGAEFGFQLLWAIALGGICVMFLVEQGGRLSAVSRHPIPGAIRERFGFNYFILLFVVVGLVSLLVFTAEIGGICIAVEMATGIRFWWWAAPVGFVVWLLMWKGPFSLIEKGTSLLGLVTISFIVGAYVMHPDWAAVARGTLPSVPSHDQARYWFLAVSILGASISPYLFFFYSSGAVEDHWDESYLNTNRIIAASGMSFGSVISIAVLILAALVFPPRGLRANEYSQLALLLQDALGYWGFVLLIASLGIACLGAALEIALELAYLAAQGFGWNWSKNQRPREEARFSIVYMIVILFGVVIIASGVDPLQLTVWSMALTAATLPISIAPFLFLMNDPHYLETHRNGWLSNSVIILIIALASVVALVTIPLQIFGGS